MKTKLTILLVLTAIPVLTISPSEARTPRPCSIYVVFDRNDTFANVRSSPNGQILAKVPNGTEAVVDDSRAIGDWSFAKFISDGYAETAGYVNKNLLSFNTTNFVLDKQDTFVNLRATPNGRVLRKVTNGTPVDILSNASVDSWVKVRLRIGDQAVGYMSRNRISQSSCPN